MKRSKSEMKRMRIGLHQYDGLKKSNSEQFIFSQFSDDKEDCQPILPTHSNEAYISYYTPKAKRKRDDLVKETANRNMDTESGYPSRGGTINVPPVTTPTTPITPTTPTTSKKEEQSTSSDVISMLVRYYRRMPMLSRIRFVELFFIIIVSSLCILRGDIFHLIILFLILTNGLQASFMISHLTYKTIMLITAISLVVKYVLQLPIFRICVNYGEEYYLTFLQTCVSEGEINYSIFQPYSLLGVTGMTHDGRVRVSTLPDVVIMVLCIMMRSTLKSYGLWEKSLVRWVVDDVGHFYNSMKSIIIRLSIENNRMVVISM